MAITRKDGVAAIISHPQDQNKILVGKRKGSHGAGSWGLPGGHVDPGEDHATTASREVLEETGLEVEFVAEVAKTEDDFVSLNKYYNTHFVWCVMKQGSPAEPQIKEPNKCDAWEWISWTELSRLKGETEPDEVIFRPLHQLLGLYPDIERLRPGKSV